MARAASLQSRESSRLFREMSCAAESGARGAMLGLFGFVNRNGVGGFIEEHAVIADAEPRQSFELTAERLDAARAGFGVAVDCFQNIERRLLLNGEDLFPHVGLEADFFDLFSRPFDLGPGPW